MAILRGSALRRWLTLTLCSTHRCRLSTLDLFAVSFRRRRPRSRSSASLSPLRIGSSPPARRARPEPASSRAHIRRCTGDDEPVPPDDDALLYCRQPGRVCRVRRRGRRRGRSPASAVDCVGLGVGLAVVHRQRRRRRWRRWARLRAVPDDGGRRSRRKRRQPRLRTGARARRTRAAQPGPLGPAAPVPLPGRRDGSWGEQEVGRMGARAKRVWVEREGDVSACQSSRSRVGVDGVSLARSLMLPLSRGVTRACCHSHRACPATQRSERDGRGRPGFRARLRCSGEFV